MFGKEHQKRIKFVWGVLSVVLIAGMILLYISPLFTA
jgi:hypothetical protein